MAFQIPTRSGDLKRSAVTIRLRIGLPLKRDDRFKPEPVPFRHVLGRHLLVIFKGKGQVFAGVVAYGGADGRNLCPITISDGGSLKLVVRHLLIVVAVHSQIPRRTQMVAHQRIEVELVA